jgi:multidrug efflux pump subunit AcrB
VPLEAVADIRLVPEEATIQRRNGARINEVRAYITAGVLPAKVLGAFEERLAAQGFQLPPGYTMSIGGEAAERDAAVGNLMSNVAPLMVLMVASLVLAFGSFRLAGLIGITGALSVGLGGGTLWLFGYPFGFMAIIGTMGLVGVAINDSIVVLAAIRDDEHARSGEPAAVRRIVMRSTRHVVATSLTTMAGFAPLMIWGGAFWGPLAVVIAGGVAGATLLALVLVPSSYLLLTGRHAHDKVMSFNRWKSADPNAAIARIKRVLQRDSAAPHQPLSEARRVPRPEESITDSPSSLSP